MTLDEVMMKRRSIRNYDAAAEVTEEQLRQIILAAQEAPSWKNQETTRYHIAFSNEKFKAVQQCLLSTNPSRVEGAKALVVVTFVKDIAGFTLEGEPNNELGNGWGIYDAGLHNMLLMLEGFGTGTRHAGYGTSRCRWAAPRTQHPRKRDNSGCYRRGQTCCRPCPSTTKGTRRDNENLLKRKQVKK